MLDGQTWESWIRRNLRTKAGRAYFHIACEAVWAAEPSDISLLHALFYAHSNADLETLLAVDRGAQQDRIAGGSVRIAEAMAAALGNRVVLGRPVRRIEHDGNGVRVIARDGSEYHGDATVVTLPPTLAGRLEYDPPLPSWRDQLTQRMPAGPVIKAYAIYPEPFWRSDGLNGQAASDAGPVKVTFDNSPPSGRPGVLMGFLEGKEARLWAGRSEADRRDAVIGCFIRGGDPAHPRATQVDGVRLPDRDGPAAGPVRRLPWRVAVPAVPRVHCHRRRGPGPPDAGPNAAQPLSVGVSAVRARGRGRYLASAGAAGHVGFRRVGFRRAGWGRAG